jgi:hypothetical protein
MPRTVRFQGTHPVFPNSCVVCCELAGDRLPISRTFIYGQHSITLQLDVPMCPAHAAQVRHKSTAELAAGWTSVTAGILIGLAAVLWLLRLWLSEGLSFAWYWAPVLLVVGLGMTLIIWVVSDTSLTPRFASRETRAARDAVHITRYDPHQDQMDLLFTNDLAGFRVARMNESSILPGKLKSYRISANLLCHDVRLNTSITDIVPVDHKPVLEEELAHLLWPAGVQLVAKNFCEGCPFELYEFVVEEIN